MSVIFSLVEIIKKLCYQLLLREIHSVTVLCLLIFSAEFEIIWSTTPGIFRFQHFYKTSVDGHISSLFPFVHEISGKGCMLQHEPAWEQTFRVPVCSNCVHKNLDKRIYFQLLSMSPR